MTFSIVNVQNKVRLNTATDKRLRIDQNFIETRLSCDKDNWTSFCNLAYSTTDGETENPVEALELIVIVSSRNMLKIMIDDREFIVINLHDMQSVGLAQYKLSDHVYLKIQGAKRMLKFNLNSCFLKKIEIFQQARKNTGMLTLNGYRFTYLEDAPIITETEPEVP